MAKYKYFYMFYKYGNKIYNNIDICCIIKDSINFFINGEVLLWISKK